MKIAILGTGNVAQLLGGALLEAGHEVVLGTRDVAATMARSEPDPFGNPPFSVWAASHSEARLVPFGELGEDAELIVNATAGVASLDALDAVGEDALEGRVVIDVANPLDFSHGIPPRLSMCNDTSLAEQIQQRFAAARVVKALSTMSARVMIAPASIGKPTTLPIAGNDQEAKALVTNLLVESFGWPAESILDLGNIEAARGMEMYLPLWLSLFGKIGHPYFNVHVEIGAAGDGGE